jgi:hypothetical protein
MFCESDANPVEIELFLGQHCVEKYSVMKLGSGNKLQLSVSHKIEIVSN